MSRVSELLAEHSRIFERPEFRFEERGTRILFDLHGGSPWLASTEDGRLVLRPSRSGDAPAHLVLELSEDDLARHITGEIDLLDPTPSRVSFHYPDHGTHRRPGGLRAERKHLAQRVLQLLALSRQCSPPFRGSVVEELYLSGRSPREDGGWEPLGNWSLPYYGGEILYRLVTSRGLRRTLEVGMAHGLSTLFIAQGLREKGGGRHVAIDPWQTRGFSRTAMVNVERAGLAEYVELIEEPDFTALPGLLAQAERFQLAFIDGLHIFDHVLLDFFYCDLLAEVGGYVVFDDSNLPAVRAALAFVLENRLDSYDRVGDLCTERITVLRKTAVDVRVDKYGVVFHRAFSTPDPEVTALAAPPHAQLLKDVFDRFLALLALLLLSPVLVGLATAILLEGLLRGDGLRSPFTVDPWISAGQPIARLRFLTEHHTGQSSTVGQLLRRLGLVHLPSIWNVLVGEMSLVGPTLIAPHEHVRRQVFRDCGMRAGLTGFQDLRGEGAADMGSDYYEDFVGRGQLSLLCLDLSILARSLTRRAARKARRLLFARPAAPRRRSSAWASTSAR